MVAVTLVWLTLWSALPPFLHSPGSALFYPSIPRALRTVGRPFASMMVIGDSVTEAYQLLPDERFPALLKGRLTAHGLAIATMPVRQFGVPALSAAHADEWFTSHPDLAEKYLWNPVQPPDLVIVQLGLNDWLHNLSDAQELKQGVPHMLSILRSHASPDATLVCMTPWGGDSGSIWNGHVPNARGLTIDQYKRLLVPLCQSSWGGPVVIVDLDQIVADPMMHNSEFDPHPNRAGQRAISDAIASVIRHTFPKGDHNWDVLS